jgi:hypothetical protein
MYRELLSWLLSMAADKKNVSCLVLSCLVGPGIMTCLLYSASYRPPHALSFSLLQPSQTANDYEFFTNLTSTTLAAKTDA